MIGRVAGRIANGEFLLQGKKIAVDKNEKGNCLHGGYYGFHK